MINHFPVSDYRLYMRRFLPDCLPGVTAGFNSLRIEPLDWDTRIFQKPTGRLRPVGNSGQKRHQREDFGKRIADSGLTMLYCRTDLRNLALVQSMERLGFFTVDVMNIYISSCDSIQVTDSVSSITTQIEPWLDWMEHLASEAFSDGCFFQDPFIKKEVAANAYRLLLRHIVQRSDAVSLVALRTDLPAGFVIGLPDSDIPELGCLWLIAVDPDHRGRVVGTELVKALASAMRQNHQFLEIGTQTANTDANRLYQNLGFRQATSLVTLHWHRQQP